LFASSSSTPWVEGAREESIEAINPPGGASIAP
jgi:hypothetical protein